VPDPKQNSSLAKGKVVSFPVMGGLHHRYERVA
jgi:hypothetical protein